MYKLGINEELNPIIGLYKLVGNQGVVKLMNYENLRSTSKFNNNPEEPVTLDALQAIIYRITRNDGASQQKPSLGIFSCQTALRHYQEPVVNPNIHIERDVDQN